MRRRRSGPEGLLAFREAGHWHDLRSEDINAYLQEKIGEGFSAKDFRAWHGTVLAAVELAEGGELRSRTAEERNIRAAVVSVAELLGNTPAVCRRSYIDPRVLDRYREGLVIKLPVGLEAEKLSAARSRRRIERRVLELIE